MSTVSLTRTGWMAPEVIRQLEGETNSDEKFYVRQAADIFPLGCIFYYVLTKGSHPFGNGTRREANILDRKVQLDACAVKTEEKFRAEAFIWLINQMIKDDERERPKANIILAHPAFWKRKKILAFFKDIYPYVELCDAFNDAIRFVTKTENWDWLEEIDAQIRDYLKSNGALNGTKCTHLLKVIVEVYKGYSKLPPNIQLLISYAPEKYLAYWGNQFPFLVPLFWTIYQYPENSISTLMAYYPVGKNEFRFGCVDNEQKGFITQLRNQSMHANAKPLLCFMDGMQPNNAQNMAYMTENGFGKISNESKILSGSRQAINISYEEISMIQDQAVKGDLHMLPNLPTNYINRILRKGENFLTEKDFLNLVGENVSKNPIAICGSSGMGKSAFLAQMGRSILKTFPKRKLFFFEIKNVADEVKKVSGGKAIDKALIWGVLQRLTGESKLGKFNYRTRTEIIFDEFNQIEYVDVELVCDILKGILGTSTSTIRLWIAIAPEVLKSREELIPNLEIYSIEPFNAKCQVKIISSYWEMHTLQNKFEMDEIARKYLADLNRSTSYDLGNPLQCLFIGAECLKESKVVYPNKPENILALNATNSNLLLGAVRHSSFHPLELVLSLNKFEYYANLNHFDEDKSNLLLFVARYGSIECLKYILSMNRFNIDSVNLKGNTPLFLSIEADKNIDCLSKLKLLLERGANLKYFNKKYNDNFLHFAARYASNECLEYILNLKEFDIDCVDIYGNTPLFFALDCRGNVDCFAKLKLLIDCGADVNHLNTRRVNLLNAAAKFGSAEVLEFVLGMNKFEIDSESNDGNTPLFNSVVQYEGIDCLEKVKMIVNRGADLNHLNKHNRINLLHYAAEYGSLDVLKYVVEMGFDINSKDKFGRTALYYAKIRESHLSVKNVDMEAKLKLLIENGCRR